MAIASRLEAIAFRSEAIASRLEAVACRLECFRVAAFLPPKIVTCMAGFGCKSQIPSQPGTLWEFVHSRFVLD